MPAKTRLFRRALGSSALLAAAILAGCSGSTGFNRDGGKDNLPPPVVERPAPPPSASAAPSMPASDTRVGQFAAGLEADLATLGQKIAAEQGQLQALFNSNTQSVEIYYGTLAAIQARLHLGTVENNPVLIEQWNEAQAALDQIAWNNNDLDQLVESLINDAAAINEVRREVQTAGGDPAGSSFDREVLMRLEREATAQLTLVDRLQQESLSALSRQASLVRVQREELASLQDAIRIGDLADTDIATAGVGQMAQPEPTPPESAPAEPLPPEPPSPAAAAPPPEEETEPAVQAEDPAPEPPAQEVAALPLDDVKMLPLVIIRFDRPNVVYEGPLERAIRKTLENNPNTQFNLVAVFPPRDDEAALLQAESASWQFAQSVFRSLTEIGVAPEQIEMRTQLKEAAKSNEVHIYVAAPQTL